MSRDHVRQGFLQDVGRDLVVEEAVEVQLAHRHHATEAGALGRSHQRGVDGLEDFGRGEAGAQVGVHSGDDVPQGDLVDVADHRGGNAPSGRVEALRELAADCAGHGGAARHADHRAGVAGHVPFAGFLIRGDGGVSLVQLDVFGGDFAGGHREGDVVVEEDLGFLFVSTVLVVVAHAFLERADAGAGHDLVVVALGDVLFGHEVAVGVVPAGLRAVGPSQQTHVPRKFEHCSGAQVDGAVRVDAELGLGARTTGAPRAQLTDGNDDDFVFRLGGDVGPVVEVDRSLLGDDRGGQRLDLLPTRGVGQSSGLSGDGAIRFLRRGRSSFLLGVGHGLRTQGLDVDGLGTEATGQVHIERGLEGLLARFGSAQVEQLGRNLCGGVGADAVTLNDGDQRVVTAHQAGATHPADLRVSEGDAARPHLFSAGTVDDGVKGALDFAVGTVAAEYAAVRGTGQHHVELVLHVGVGTDVAEAGDGAFHAPQHQSGLRFEQVAGVGERAMDRRSGEREEQGRLPRRLQNRGGSTGGLLLLVAHPVDQCVDVAVAGEVGRNQPQLGVAGSVLAVGLLSPSLNGRLEAVRGGHHSGTACEQAFDHLSGNRVRAHAGDDGDIIRVTGGVLVGRNLFEGLGAGLLEGGLEFFALRLVGEPLGFGGDGLAKADEAAVQGGGIVVVVGAGEVFTGGGPPIIEEDGLVGVEARSDLLGPVGAKFGFNRGHDGGVLVLGFFRSRSGHAELVQHEAGGGGEHAVGTGDLLGEGVERGGIDHSATSGTTGGRQGHGNTLELGDDLNGRINQLVGFRLVLHGGGGQLGQVAATGAGTLASVEQQCGEHAGHPTFTELPYVGHAVADVLLLDAGGTEQRAQAVAQRLGEHGTERLVVRGGLVDDLGELVERRFSSTVHAGDSQLGADVHEQLVAARRDTVGQGVGGVVAADLVETHLGGVGHEHADGIGSLEGQVGDGGTGRCASRGLP